MSVFTLNYRRGSFAQSAKFNSRANALAGAYALINQEGHHAFSLEGDGNTIMVHSQIEAHCHAVKIELLSGRMPARSQ